MFTYRFTVKIFNYRDFDEEEEINLSIDYLPILNLKKEIDNFLKF